MENFTGLKVAKEQFTLRKIIVNSKSKLGVVDCEVDSSTAEKTKIFKVKIEPDYQIRESFQRALTAFRPWLMNVCNIESEHEKDVIVTGVELKGSGEKATWKIYGVQVGVHDHRMPFATHKSHFDSGHYVFEGELIGAVADLEEEVFEYAFNDARAELSLFDHKAEENKDAEMLNEENSDENTEQE